MLVNLCNALEDWVGGNSGGFSACFVSKCITWNGRMARELLNGNGRGAGINGIMN